MKSLLLLVLVSMGSFSAMAEEASACNRVVAPFRTEVFRTTKDCNKLKSTNTGLSDDFPAYVIGKITCDGESYSVIQTVAPGYDGTGVYTVKTKDLIK
ncbi:MAG: hypothetical protein J7501_09855 [Bdellovibrio sp.]|nr:hypothetical protein [Bdellovibrio sp.]